MGISAVFPKDLLGFWLVQPFATIEEKACFGLEMAFNFPCPVSAAAS
jgi:hypothetical protein